MKYRFALPWILFTSILSLNFSWSAAASNPSPQPLVTKIVKAGLGCKTISAKTKLFSGSARWNCEVNGENISIEVFPPSQWKDYKNIVCPPNYGFIAVTDNKTWVVIPESRLTAQKLTKPLGGVLKVFCDGKHISNETKAKAPKATPSAVPSPTPKSTSIENPVPSTSPTPIPSATLGSEENPFPLGSSVSNASFLILVKTFIPEATNQACSDLYAANYFNTLCGGSEGELNPNRNQRYIGFTLEIKNLGSEVDYATHSADYFALIPGTFYYAQEDFAGYSMSRLLAQVNPNETLSANVYFREPLDVIFSQVRLKIEQGEKTYYFATK